MAEAGKYNRAFPRRTVLFKGSLKVNSHQFTCNVLDLSLSGARIKLDLPLASDTEVELTIQDYKPLKAAVAWAAEGFMGLMFKAAPETVRESLGTVGERLPNASQE
jgi:hypothetical protein